MKVYQHNVKLDDATSQQSRKRAYSQPAAKYAGWDM